MIIENTGLKGAKSELKQLDNVMSEAGFVRWQWEYTRATYDYKIQENDKNADYYLRINARAIEGKLENPFAVLQLEEVYIGVATFPHGVDYNSPIPTEILNTANQKIAQIKLQFV